MIVALLVLYPSLNANQLVGTDLVQAVPLVASAAVAHYFFGDFSLDVTSSLLVGAIPGVYVGARFSSRANGAVVRRALALVLVASSLKLLGVDTAVLAWVLLACVVVAPLVWMQVRRAHGLPALARWERAQRRGTGSEQPGSSAEPVVPVVPADEHAASSARS